MNVQTPYCTDYFEIPIPSMAVDSEVHKSLPFHMALRVLLADESTTIKKVLQLALQDFAVEVKSVHSGVDVVEVARSFQPDIVFADVLLQKKNGYEVTTDLKNDPELNSIPVVLMWSSFMELDEGSAHRSRADRRLEKPFDVESLRQLVLELVPKTRSQRLAHFLKFPDSVTEPLLKEEQLKAKGPAPKSAAPPTERTGPDETMLMSSDQMNSGERSQRASDRSLPNPSAQAPSSNWSMDSFQDIDAFSNEETGEEPGRPPAPNDPGDDESFVELKLTRAAPGKSPPPAPKSQEPSADSRATDENEPWSHQSLARFQIQTSEDAGIHAPADEAYEIDLTSQIDTAAFANQLEPQRFTDPNEEEISEFNLELENERQTAAGPLDLRDRGAFSPPPPAPNPSRQQTSRPSVPQPPAESLKEIPNEVPELKLSLEREDEEPLELDPHGGIPQITPEHLEAIIRSQSREVIETVVRRLVPDLASQIIREELARLLAEGPDPTPTRGRPAGTSIGANTRETSARK